jgi:hypothetical protein
MSLLKCASVGCQNTVARRGDRCDECKSNDLTYGPGGRR